MSDGNGTYIDPSIITRTIYLNPFFDYSSLFQPAIWPNALRWCHPPGTYIELGCQGIISIEDLFTGDIVATPGGDCELLNIIEREYDGNLICVRPYGLDNIQMTPDHKIWVTDNLESLPYQIKAEELRPGLWVMSPKWKQEPGKNWGGLLELYRYHKAPQFDSIEAALSYVVCKFARHSEDKQCSVHVDSFLPMMHNLAYQVIYGIYKACEALGIRCGWYKDHVVIYTDDLHRVVDDDVAALATEASENIAFDHKYCYRKVVSVETRPYKGSVYSLTVDTEHCYVADGILVNNCEYIVMTNGVLRAALERIVSFFIADIEIEGTDSLSQRHYMDFLRNKLGIIEKLRVLGMDYLTYGNFFVSFLFPTVRTIYCGNQSCGYSFGEALQALRKEKVRFENYAYHGTCPQCHYSGELRFVDLNLRDPDKISIKRWNIYEIMLEYDFFTDSADIIWKIPAHYKDAIHRSDPMAVANVPQSVLECLQQGAGLRFDPGAIYHGKDETLCGLQLRGWGLSRVFSSIRHAWYYQVLHRVNEAIGMDYIVPLRIITPMPRSGGEMGDPLAVRNMANFTQHILSVVEQRRRDPTIWHVSPFPLDYKSLGGDGRAYAPRDLMESAMDTLLNSLNIPVEFYRGTMNMTSAPVSLKLMEASWSHMIIVMNKFLSWLADKLHKYLEWDKVDIRLARTPYAQSVDNLLATLRLMSEGRVSQTTGMSALGLNAQEELRRIMEEQVYAAKQTIETQKEIEGLSAGQQMAAQAAAQAAAMGAGPPPGQMPAEAAGSQAQMMGGQAAAGQPMAFDPVQQILANLPVSSMQQVSPQDIDKMAANLAMQLFSQPEVIKDSVLRQLKGKNELLWMSVKNKLDDMRDAARRQGIVSLQQMMAQQAAGMAQPPG